MTDERRRFQDAQGNGWEIDAGEDFKWHFVPLEDTDRIRTIVTPPPEVDDPFDLDEHELQKLLDSGISTRGIREPLPSTGEG